MSENTDEEEEEERILKVALMRTELILKTKQGFWETPRNLAIVGAALSAIVATVAGLAGFKAGQIASTPTPAPQIIFQPGSIQVLPRP